MSQKLEQKIFSGVKEEMVELADIEQNLIQIREKMLEKVPSHFSLRDLVNSTFSSLIIGLTFVFKGNMVQTALLLDKPRLYIIVFCTQLILIAEIYFIGYSRVKNKSQRKFGQFMTKRLLALYVVTVLVSFFLVYLFAFDKRPDVASFYDILRIVITLSMPCAVGAAIPSLLKQY